MKGFKGMASNVDIYVMNVDPASIVWGAHPYLTQNQRERDLQLGDTFTSCYDIKKNTHDEMLSGIPPDCTPLNVQPIYLTIVKMEERMGGHIRWLESLSAASGRYAGLHLVGTGLEHVTTGRCLRTDGAMK